MLVSLGNNSTLYSLSDYLIVSMHVLDLSCFFVFVFGILHQGINIAFPIASSNLVLAFMCCTMQSCDLTIILYIEPTTVHRRLVQYNDGLAQI